MPFKDPERQKEYMRAYKRKNGATYMRDFRKQKRKKEQNKNTSLIVKLTQMMDNHAHTCQQLVDIINMTGFIVDRTDLTDSEKVARISDITIPNELLPYFKQVPKEVTA